MVTSVLFWIYAMIEREDALNTHCAITNKQHGQRSANL